MMWFWFVCWNSFWNRYKLCVVFRHFTKNRQHKCKILKNGPQDKWQSNKVSNFVYFIEIFINKNIFFGDQQMHLALLSLFGNCVFIRFFFNTQHQFIVYPGKEEWPRIGHRPSKVKQQWKNHITLKSYHQNTI